MAIEDDLALLRQSNELGILIDSVEMHIEELNANYTKAWAALSHIPNMNPKRWDWVVEYAYAALRELPTPDAS